MSRKLTPAASRSTRSCPAPGRGSGSSRGSRTSGPPFSVTTIACKPVSSRGADGRLARLSGSRDESPPPPGSECMRRRFEEARPEMLGQQETAVMDRNSRFERAGRGVHVPFFVAGPGARDAAPADGAAGLAPGDDAPRPMPAGRTWAIVAAALLAGVGVMAVQVL